MIINVRFDHNATYEFNKKYKTSNIINQNKNIKHPSKLRSKSLVYKVILNEFLKLKNLLYSFSIFYILKLIRIIKK
jgi:hypothetical protein